MKVSNCNDQTNSDTRALSDENTGLSFLQMTRSVLASFLGVQSSKNRTRDFTHGKAKDFIIVGILMTAVWYGAIYGVVTLVLK